VGLNAVHAAYWLARASHRRRTSSYQLTPPASSAASTHPPAPAPTVADAIAAVTDGGAER